MVRMLRGGLFAAAALVAAACTLSAPGIPADARTGADLVVDSLHITENGAASPDADLRDCQGFVLDEDAVTRALEGGEPISRDRYMHDLPWSPCLARGRLVLTDGRTGAWTIRQYGTGSVLLDDGGELFLWCRACTRPPFVPVE